MTSHPVRCAGPFAVLLLPLCAACSGTPPEEIPIAPALSGYGYPAQKLEDLVYVQARFDPDYRRALGVDLLRSRVVPILISFTLRGEGQEHARVLLNEEHMNPRLFLPDGSVLYPISGERLAESLPKKFAPRVRDAAFAGNLLRTDRPLANYLYFQLAPSEEYRIEDGTIWHTREGITVVMELTSALLVVDVDVEDRLRSFHVGLQR